jgi:D-sedoheptulose 7-phosphate isomerase
MDNRLILNRALNDGIEVKTSIINDDRLAGLILKAADTITGAFKNQGKVLFCGNGGSAADAQHLAAEFSGRFYFDRDPLFAEALHVNTSYLTAVANDYSYDDVYCRLVRAKGRPGDVLVALSTSGNSKNIIRALETARDIGMSIVGFTGVTGGEMRDRCNILLNVPSGDTPRIQEAHIMIGHIICEIVEKELFGERPL